MTSIEQFFFFGSNNNTLFVLENIQEKYISMLIGLTYFNDDYAHIQKKKKKNPKILRGKSKIKRDIGKHFSNISIGVSKFKFLEGILLIK